MYTPYGLDGCDLGDRVGSGEPALARLLNRGLIDWHVDPLLQWRESSIIRTLTNGGLFQQEANKMPKDSATVMRALTASIDEISIQAHDFAAKISID